MIYVVVSTTKFGMKKFHSGRDSLSRITTKGTAERVLKEVSQKTPDAEIMKFKNMTEACQWSITFRPDFGKTTEAPAPKTTEAPAPKTTADLAAEFGLDKSSIDSYLTFVTDNLKREPKLREFLKTNPDAFMKTSIENWMKTTTAIYNEIIEGTSDFAKKFRDDLWEMNNTNKTI